MKELTEREQWFRDRIGKRVYRGDNGCNCEICKKRTDSGILIIDITHADYLFMIESESQMGLIQITYFDTKEEVK
jgi:hypothetical protein